jgi:hypothetical protein
MNIALAAVTRSLNVVVHNDRKQSPRNSLFICVIRRVHINIMPVAVVMALVIVLVVSVVMEILVSKKH